MTVTISPSKSCEDGEPFSACPVDQWRESALAVSWRLARGIERDGQAARRRWIDEWMPAEDAYVSAMGPHCAAMLVVDGQGRPGLDPRRGVTIVEARPPFDGLVRET
ncbi:MAG: hypothetical protein OXC00_08450 [Acidimicrobiaceae bacterium]|nr:hypothetical protein [Acidimicrobiaceae bacterium]